MALDRQVSHNPASASNDITASGKRKPANHTSPTEGHTPRVAGRPPAPPTPSGQTGGVGFTRSRAKAGEALTIPAQGSVVHGAATPSLAPALDSSPGAGAIPTKRCPACGQTYPHTNEFFHRSPHLKHGCDSYCKGCRRAAARERQKTEHARAYDVMRLHSSPVHREKLLARKALRGAIRYGKIVRPSTCQECSTECVPNGHHEDYAKPFDVEWLCSSCHGKRHRGLITDLRELGTVAVPPAPPLRATIANHRIRRQP